MQKIKKYLKIIFINLILIVYLLELLLLFFLPAEQRTLTEIKKTRIKKANELGMQYDLRSPEEAYFDLSQNNLDLSPTFYFNRTFANLKIFKKALSRNDIIPFRGPINKKTLSCAEDLNYKLITNDKLGFKNPNSIYKKKIQIALLGDSYVEGLCYDENNDIAGNFRKEKYNSINLGVLGSGPLLALGVFREYVKNFKPDFVIYMYFEGNDIPDLNWEKNNLLLKKYLDENYSQNLLSRQNEIKTFLLKSSNESIKHLNKRIKIINNAKHEKISGTKDKFRDYIELSRLKNSIRNIFYFFSDKSFDEDLFFKIINDMDVETQSWGGKFIFVYTPTWSRYFTRFTRSQRYTSKKNYILKKLKKDNISTINLTNFFDKQTNKKQYFPLGYLGHYNKKGYKKIADIIIEEIKHH
jgi:hypothetical protein|tara:strand:+ start:221 stop:1453 length:1233 start_codon:yes stop_codon:yes gene_type:complete